MQGTKCINHAETIFNAKLLSDLKGKKTNQNNTAMKSTNKCYLLTALLSLSSLLVQTASAQMNYGQKLLYKTGNPDDWPKDQDAVIAAPGNHKILLENDSVRVLEVTVLPKEVEPVHHHRWPSVLYIMEAGHFIDRDAEGNVILDTRELATPLVFPMTVWKDPEAPHSVENLSDTKKLRLIRVELKK